MHTVCQGSSKTIMQAKGLWSWAQALTMGSGLPDSHPLSNGTSMIGYKCIHVHRQAHTHTHLPPDGYVLS